MEFGLRASSAKSVIQPHQTLGCPRQVICPRRKQTRRRLNFVVVAIRFLNGRFCFFKKRERDAHLKSAFGIQIEKMICAPDGFVGDAFLVEEFAKLSVDAGIVALPKSANRIFPRFRRVSRATGWAGKLSNQRHVAIGAHGEPLAIFRFALGADHHLVEFTTRDCRIQRGSQRARRHCGGSPGATKAQHSPAAGIGRGMRLFGVVGRIPSRMATTTYWYSALMSDDAMTVARGLQRRDPELLDRLIEQYQYRLFRYLVYLTASRERAEDFFQETWIRVLERGHQYDGKSKFEAWLFAIARHLVIDWQRQKKMQSLDARTDPEDGAPVEIADENEPTPLALVLSRERETKMQASLEQVPTIYREVLLLRFQEDLKLEEIAGVLETPISTVKSRLYRGLESLKGLLQGGAA
jgi:RNA polymerase sigma-70 factor, ECF subfamily